MIEEKNNVNLKAPNPPYTFHVQEWSEWKCYMFGNKPEVNDGISYVPKKGCEPNWFVRWMMKVCFGCTWVKEKK